MYKKRHEIGDIWQGEDGYLVTMNENSHIERYWSKQMTERFVKAYPRTTNEDLCTEFDLTMSAVKTKAKKMGLRKDYKYFYEIHKEELREKARMSKNRSRHGAIGRYMHNETEEQKRIRIEHSAEARRNAPLSKKLMQRKRVQETIANKTDEEKARISKKISDSWKDPDMRARRIAKLKETLSKKSKAEKAVTNYLISAKRKAFFAKETEEEKIARCEKMRQIKLKSHEECRNAM